MFLKMNFLKLFIVQFFCCLFYRFPSFSLEQPPNFQNSQFDGWWKSVTIGQQSGFYAGNNTTGIGEGEIDQYIFIDTSVYPVQVKTTYGTDKFPRLTRDFFDPAPTVLPPIPGVPTPNSYIYQGPNQLINAYNTPLKGLINSNISQSYGPTLKLYDENTLYSFLYANNHFCNRTGTVIIYKKMKGPPIDTSGLDWNDPVNLFNFYVSIMSFENNSKNVHALGNNYVGNKKAAKILKKFLSDGFTVTKPIRKIRITNKTANGPLNNYEVLGISTDSWTTVYTDGFANVTLGSSPTISGATGFLSVLNGTYPNGVSILNNGANLKLDKKFVDKGKGGSFNDLYNSFLLNLDTSSLAPYADPATGFIDVPDGVTVTVTYTINRSTEYAEFVSACAAWWYATFRTGTHFLWAPFSLIGSARIVDTWSELQSGLKNGTVVDQFISGRISQPQVNGFYHNWPDIDATKSGQDIMVNCPYPLNSANSTLKYDVPLGNYLINVQNLYFTIRGVLEPDQPDPTDFGFPFIHDPNAGRAHFEGLVGPATVVNGVIEPTIPADYSSLGFGSDLFNLNNHYFGQINPALTGGKVWGYLRQGDNVFLDVFAIMIFNGIYTKNQPNQSKNPRIAREALSEVYSAMMKWFNSIGCEKIIIDQTNDIFGGTNDILYMSEFMGTDRLAYNQLVVPKSTKKKLLENTDIHVVNNASKKQGKGAYQLYVSKNEKFYSGSVFKGDKHHPKEVLFLTDIFSYSGGDSSPNFFLGHTGKGDLGSNTWFHLVGCVDGREFGFGDDGGYFPVNVNPVSANKNLINMNGDPVSPFFIGKDIGSFFGYWTKRNLSQIRQNKGIQPIATPIKGTSGGNALPISYETTLFPDLGFTPPIRPPIPGWTSLHSFPPNPNDPSTWMYTYLDAAILYASEKHENKKEGKSCSVR